MTQAKKGATPRVERVNMTQDLAEQLRSLNIHNRNLRERIVRAYARDMLRGEWIETGDTIKVSNTNKLIDGQHRLEAFLLASQERVNLVIPMWIAWDLDEASQDATDAGIKRLLADQLKLRGKSHPHVLASILRVCHAWTLGERRGLGNVGSATTSTLLDFLRKHPELEEIAREANFDATRCALTASVLGLTHWVLSDIDADDAEAFFEKLTSDSGLVKGDPIFELRKAATRTRDSDYRRSQAKLAALTIKAWNMWRQGQTLGDTGLSFKMGGATPEKFPEPM